MTARIRIGAVSFLNTRPLVHGLERGIASARIELSYATPAVLAERMALAELDVALLPVIELANLPPLELIPGLAITTRGACASVLLVSKLPLDRVRRVALDPDSRTSNALCQVLFADAWGARPDFAPGPAQLESALEGHDAVVRIGDKALFEQLPAGVTAHDLGQVWTETTGLPFVFAAWAAWPGIVDRELYQALHASRREGSRAIEEIARAWQWQGRAHPEVVRDYLTRHIAYRLGTAELDAMRLFFERAAAAGAITRPPRIRLALDRHTTCDEIAAQRGLLAR